MRSEREIRTSIGFINWGHALDHYVMLIFPTVVISLQVVYDRSYAELIALGTASFVAFGVFALPAGWRCSIPDAAPPSLRRDFRPT